MTTLKIDIKNSSRISDSKNGTIMDRVAIVSELSGATIQADLALYNAINAVGLPVLGDEHPEVTGIYLISKTGEPLGANKTRVTMTYSSERSYPGTSNTAVRVTASTAIESVREDKNGLVMITNYKTPADVANDPDTTSYYRFTANMEQPRATFEFEYTVDAFPQTTINTYLGKINSAVWNGYAIKTILCTGFTVNQQGSKWLVGVTFSFNPNTWEFNGMVPAPEIESSTDGSLDLETGIRPWDIYDEVDFTALGLVFEPAP